jgi:hypothetical protein
MWMFCYSRKPLRHRISFQEVLQLRDGEAGFSFFAIVVLSGDQVLSHASVKDRDHEVC